MFSKIQNCSSVLTQDYQRDRKANKLEKHELYCRIDSTTFEQKVENTYFAQTSAVQHDLPSIESDTSQFTFRAAVTDINCLISTSVNCWFLPRVLKSKNKKTEIGQFFVLLFCALQFYRKTFQLVCRYVGRCSH